MTIKSKIYFLVCITTTRIRILKFNTVLPKFGTTMVVPAYSFGRPCDVQCSVILWFVCLLKGRMSGNDGCIVNFCRDELMFVFSVGKVICTSPFSGELRPGFCNFRGFLPIFDVIR